MAVDAADRVPAGHLDLLAAHGFYGLAAPADAGGLGIEDRATASRIVEILASGCLTTTFVWLQHHGAVAAVTDGPLRDDWLTPLARGERRAGVVLAGLRPGPPSVRATPVGGGYLIDGDAPWVTGWEMVDVLHAAARTEDGTVVWALLDAVAGPTLSVAPLDLVAAAASRTVQVRFDGHFVPHDRITGAVPYARWPERDAASLRTNGSLALGVAGRCLHLAGTPAGVVDEARATLDAATPQAMPEARAAASALAMRAATTLAVTAGSRSVLAGEHPQRLVREAMFLLVFGSRPAIRQALLRQVRPEPGAPG
jgi:alkylation response protein AidB-like acyl-CoA dehydrogenase